jgi:NADH dehydrogenase
VQPIHLDDLVKALLACLALKTPAMLCVAAPEGIRFAAFLKAVARERTVRRPMIVPVPRLLILMMAELLGPNLSGLFGLTQIRSLFALRQMHTTGDLEQLSLELRPLTAGMSRSGRERRGLLREGRAMLTYVLRETPADVLVRRYVRAIETLRSPQALQLPYLVLDMPNSLSLIDEVKDISTTFRQEFNWRLTAALMLGEASPQGARRFLGSATRNGRVRFVIRITRALVTGICLRALQRFLRPWLSRFGRQGTYR